MRRVLAIVGGAALCAGCVPYAPAQLATGQYAQFEALWARDLAAFEQQIATTRHAGEADGWTEVAQAWLDFANCDAIDRDVSQDAFEPAAAWAYATLLAEESRRAHALASNRARVDALFVEVAVADFFARDADREDDAWIVWPAADEGWVDEQPAAAPVASRCATLRERIAETPLRPNDEDSPVRTALDWFAVAEQDVADALNRYDALPPSQQTGAVERLHWSLRAFSVTRSHEAANASAATAARLGRGTQTVESTAQIDAARHRARKLRAKVREQLPQLMPIPAVVEDEDAARVLVLTAIYALEDGDAAAALEQLSAARARGVDADNFWAARYLELRIASDTADWARAAQLADGLPPRDAPVFGAYHYRVAVAMKHRGEVDRFLNTAMKAFRDRDYTRDPFLRALYREMLRTLADVPFEARVTELLEELGHRGDTARRVEEYAHTALDRGQPDNADAAARWLLAHSNDARDLPRYYGILAIAAFVDDDVDRFNEALAKLTERPSAVTGALPERRQPQFFANADAQLATVLRQLLPAMAEWGDDATARNRRQRWLRHIVHHAQQFIRHTSNTVARPQLVELYRLASGLLEDHPRGYAERVGEGEPAPMLLGTVRVEGRDLAEFEPLFEVVVPVPYSLLLVPRDGVAMTQWPSRWPKGATETAQEVE